MDDNLANLVDQQRIVGIDATPVPAPPHATVQGEYLFVNCHYSETFAATPKAELLDAARCDTLEICRRLALDARLQGCVAAVVSVYGHFPVLAASRPARRRIYRATILSQDLRSNRVDSPTFLTDVHAEESSELDEVAELLHEATP